MAEPPTVLVTGASGFVGSAIVERLLDDGVRVIASSRTACRLPAGVKSHLWADPRSVDWREDLRSVDVVVHSAARTHIRGHDARSTDDLFRTVNVELTRDIAVAAAASGVRRLVYLSSAHVNGSQTSDHAFAANDVPSPQTPYARSKWEAEQCLTEIAKETGLEVVIVRPPLVIGRHPKGNLATLVTAMRRGFPLPLGAMSDNRRDLVEIDTLTDFVSCAIGHPAAPGGALMVSDGRPMSTREILERLAAMHGLTPRLVAVSPALIGRLLRLLGRDNLAAQLLGNLEIDISETCRRLDWRPPMKSAA